MWIAMMVAMMLPSAAAGNLMLYARVHRHSFGNEVGLPIAGIPGRVIWSAGFGFALLAATLHWWSLRRCRWHWRAKRPLADC
jgi:predicted metal-binding membrane protein